LSALGDVSISPAGVLDVSGTLYLGGGTLADVKALEALGLTVTRMSRCGLGQTAANPILSTMRNFPQAYEARLRPEPYVPRLDLDEALAEATEIRRHPQAAGEERA